MNKSLLLDTIASEEVTFFSIEMVVFCLFNKRS